MSGDTSGHSSWCGDNVEDEKDMKDPQAIIEAAMKFIKKHNKIVWDPMTWTIPPATPAPPSLPPSATPRLPSPPLPSAFLVFPSSATAVLLPAVTVTVAPSRSLLFPAQPQETGAFPSLKQPSGALPALSTLSLSPSPPIAVQPAETQVLPPPLLPSGVLAAVPPFVSPASMRIDVAPIEPVLRQESPGQSEETGALSSSPSALLHSASLIGLVNTDLSLTPPSLPLASLPTFPPVFLSAQPTAHLGGPTLLSMRPHNDSTAETSSEGLPKLQYIPLLPSTEEFPLHQGLEQLAAANQEVDPGADQDAVSQQQPGLQDQALSSERRMDLPETSLLLTPSEFTSGRRNPVLQTNNDLDESLVDYMSLFSAPYSKKSLYSPMGNVQQPLKPTRLTVSRSPAEFDSQEEPLEDDEHHLKVDRKLQAPPVFIRINSLIQPVKYPRVKREIL